MKKLLFLFLIPFFVIFCFVPRTSHADNTIKYAILTNKNLGSAFAALANYKNSVGIKTQIFYIEDMPNYPGVTLLQERVRIYITNLQLKYGFRYLLIGGDCTVIPPSFYYLSNSYSAAANLPITIPTDIYYGLLSPANLPYNGGALGLPANGKLNFDIVVGRAPVNTFQQAIAFVAKTIYYSVDVQTLRLHRNVVLGEMLTQANPLPAPSQLSFASTALTYNEPGFGSIVKNTPYVDTFFESVKCNGASCGINLFSPQDESNAIDTSTPRHIDINFSHGDSYETMKHLRELTAPPSPLIPGDLININTGVWKWESNLINSSSPDFIFNMGCLTASYDHIDPMRINGLQKAGLLTPKLQAAMLTYPSIGEEFILNPSSRTVAYIGNSRQWVGESNLSVSPDLVLYNRLVYMTFQVHDNLTLGDALTTAKESYANDGSNRLIPTKNGKTINDTGLSEFYSVNLLGNPTDPL